MFHFSETYVVIIPMASNLSSTFDKHLKLDARVWNKRIIENKNKILGSNV